MATGGVLSAARRDTPDFRVSYVAICPSRRMVPDPVLVRWLPRHPP